MSELILEKVPTFYHKYIELIKEKNLEDAFKRDISDMETFFTALPGDKWDYSYDQGKWTINEVIQHMIDAERIFCYRALTFARLDNIMLPGFDENHYATVAKAHKRKPEDLVEEMSLVHKASAKLFQSFDEEQLRAEGIANNNKVYVGGIGYIIVGHSRHHFNIIKERYLK